MFRNLTASALAGLLLLSSVGLALAASNTGFAPDGTVTSGSAGLALGLAGVGFGVVLSLLGSLAIRSLGRVTLTRVALVAVAAVLALGLTYAPALAQTVVTDTGNAVGTTGGTTVVTLPYGEYVAGAQSILTTVVTAIIGLVVAYLPFPIRWALNAYGADRLAKDAVNIAIAATPGASKDAKLDVDVGSKVLAKALNYFIQNSAPRLVKAAGGIDALQNKLIGLIPLHAETTATEVKVLANSQPASPIV